MKNLKFIKSAKSLISNMRVQNKYEYRLISLLTGLLLFVVIVGGIIFPQINSIAFNVKLDRSDRKSTR
ncbi:MAG: hypothetical protein KJ941_12665, partial [Bacteroidetes bacterium]|nr:hypothetical protein [Bacteroidota bacterium]